MMTYLAEVAQQTDGMSLREILPWVTTLVVAIIGAVMAPVLKSRWRADGKQEALQIGPQPFIVQMREEFATRRELEKVEATMTAHAAEMKAAGNLTAARMESLFERTMEAVEKQSASSNRKIEGSNDRLNKKIEEVASGAYQGRQRIHNIQNTQGERLARIEEGTNVAASLEKLANAISPGPTKVVPTHNSNANANA